MQEAVNVIGDLLLIAAFFGGLWLWVLYDMKRRYTEGVLRGRSGTRYTYVLGDRLHYDDYRNGVFSGISILLPAVMPNIYLDGRVREKLRGPRHFMRQSQRLELEGGFGRYFTCYVPRGYQTLALSILAPDVMQTLLKQVPDCDVEFRFDHVRIIVNGKVHNRVAASAALLRAAEAVLSEVDDRLRSWTAQDSEAAMAAVLISEDNPTIKVLGLPVRLSSLVLGTIYGVLGVVVWWVFLGFVAPPTFHMTAGQAAANYWVPFLIFPVVWGAVVFGYPRGWLDPLFKLMNHLIHR